MIDFRNKPVKTMMMFLIIFTLLFTAVFSIAQAQSGTHILSASQTDEGITATLYSSVEPSGTLTVHLIDESGRLYIMPVEYVDEHLWQANFPIKPSSAVLSAYEDGEFLAMVSLDTDFSKQSAEERDTAPVTTTPSETSLIIETPVSSEQVRMSTSVHTSKDKEIKASMHIRDRVGRELTVPTDIGIELAKQRYEVTITPENSAVKDIVFHDLLAEVEFDLGIEDLPRAGPFKTMYAIDPSAMNFTNATVTVVATGEDLYKCAEWNFTQQSCGGEWNLIRDDLVPGVEYSFTITPTDPAYGETDSESLADTCIYSDESGQGSGDSNTDCSSAIISNDGLFDIDIEDSENTGTASDGEISMTFTNSFLVDAIHDVMFYVEYRRVTNNAVGATTAYIDVWDNGAYVQACSDTVTINAWDTFPCDLSTYVTTQAELNDIDVRVRIDTSKQAAAKDTGLTYVDFAYVFINITETDTEYPQYSAISATPPSPQTYSLGEIYEFNTTWTDNVGVTSVQLQNNFSGSLGNDTIVSGSEVYSFSTQLAAGTYSWKYFASDAATLWNATDTFTYVVNKASPAFTLDFNGTSDNITVNNTATVDITGTLSAGEAGLDILREDAIIASSASPVSINEVFSTLGTHNITLRYNATENYTQKNVSYTVTVQDTIDAGVVSSLTNASNGVSWINWSWSNAGLAADLDYLEVYINGSSWGTTTQEWFNTTGLSASSYYTIGIRSKDTRNNFGAWVNASAYTTSSQDTMPPVLESILNHSHTTTSVNISLSADEPVSHVTYYGTSPGVYDQSVENPAKQASHEIKLTSLQPDTTYYYAVNLSDIADNWLYTAEYSFTTLADAIAPTWSDVSATPPSPQDYSPGQSYQFNTTWTDESYLFGAIIEHNFTGVGLVNDTPTNVSSIFTFSSELGAGTYQWRYFANDTSSNWNASDVSLYTVNKAASEISLLINGTRGDNSVNEDSLANFTTEMITPSTGTLRIYFDGNLYQTGTDRIINLSYEDIPGTYNVSAIFLGNENYSSDIETHYLTVVDTTAPEVTLLSPDPGHNDTDSYVVFEYSVLEHGTLANCSLVINDSIDTVNSTPQAGAASFIKESMADGTYAWSVRCDDSASNTGQPASRILYVDKQTIQINVTATSTGDWSTGTNPVAIVDINSTDGAVESHTVNSGLTNYITWTNFSTANLPIGSTVVSADFYVYHQGTSNKATFSGVDWYSGASYIGTGCAPVPQTGVYRTDSCNLPNVDTIEEANDISLRYKATGSGNPSGTFDIDHMYVTITYIRETTPPVLTNVTNVTVGLNRSLGAQFSATDLAGIKNWTVNNTADFKINSTGYLENNSVLALGTYWIDVSATDTNDNTVTESIAIIVKDLVTINLTSLSSSGTSITIYNSTGGVLNIGENESVVDVLRSELYDIVLDASTDQGSQVTTLFGVNLSREIDIESQVVDSYSGDMPNNVSEISTVFALNISELNFTYAEVLLPKKGVDIEYIFHCTEWDFGLQNCTTEWEVNETSEYQFQENATHLTINVTRFDAYGGGPGDTLANITSITLYDVTGQGDTHAGGSLVRTGINSSYNLSSGKTYRAELNITNEARKWVIASSDIAYHNGLDSSWTVDTVNDIWYTPDAGVTNYTGGTYSGGKLSWDLSLGGTLESGAEGTWFYVFNVTTTPADYSLDFLVNDTSKESGSTDVSKFSVDYDIELVVNETSIATYGTFVEGSNVTINATIFNIGRENSGTIRVEFIDNITMSVLDTQDITVTNKSSALVQYNWTVEPGARGIIVAVDTLDAVSEFNETNNNYTASFEISSWQIFYGDVTKNLTLAGSTSAFHTWPLEQASGFIFASDADASIDWSSVQALGRKVDDSAASSDFTQADTNLSLTSLPDNVNTLFSSDGSAPLLTRDWTFASAGLVQNVPVVNTTNNTYFQTGLLWDASDDGGDSEYSGTEDLVFVTSINSSKAGLYGEYDYELRIPSTLQTTQSGTDEVYLYYEIQ